jgi:hypothetical protein
VATGAGHHSVIHHPAADAWYMVYHRRPLGQLMEMPERRALIKWFLMKMA